MLKNKLRMQLAESSLPMLASRARRRSRSGEFTRRKHSIVKFMNSIDRPSPKFWKYLSNLSFHFLGWVRLNYVHGDEAWQFAERKSLEERRLEILTLGGEWKETDDTRIPKNNLARLNTVEKIFGSRESLAAASKKEITEGLLSLHAFEEQLRFTTGGLKNLPGAFWHENKDNVERVRGSITHLVHDPGDFIIRLHDLLYDKRFKLGLFARFCALELFGTIKPNE